MASVFQIIPTSLECSITQSSHLGPSSRLLRTWACCWQLQGSSRVIYRKAADCLHGNPTTFLLFVWKDKYKLAVWKHFISRDVYSDRSGSSTPDSEISEIPTCYWCYMNFDTGYELCQLLLVWTLYEPVNKLVQYWSGSPILLWPYCKYCYTFLFIFKACREPNKQTCPVFSVVFIPTIQLTVSQHQFHNCLSWIHCTHSHKAAAAFWTPGLQLVSMVIFSPHLKQTFLILINSII